MMIVFRGGALDLEKIFTFLGLGLIQTGRVLTGQKPCPQVGALPFSLSLESCVRADMCVRSCQAEAAAAHARRHRAFEVGWNWRKGAEMRPDSPCIPRESVASARTCGRTASFVACIKPISHAHNNSLGREGSAIDSGCPRDLFSIASACYSHISLRKRKWLFFYW